MSYVKRKDQESWARGAATTHTPCEAAQVIGPLGLSFLKRHLPSHVLKSCTWCKVLAQIRDVASALQCLVAGRRHKCAELVEDRVVLCQLTHRSCRGTVFWLSKAWHHVCMKHGGELEPCELLPTLLPFIHALSLESWRGVCSLFHPQPHFT